MLCSRCGRPTEGMELSEGAISAICEQCESGGVERPQPGSVSRGEGAAAAAPIARRPRRTPAAAAADRVK